MDRNTVKLMIDELDEALGEGKGKSKSNKAGKGNTESRDAGGESGERIAESRDGS